MSPADEVSGVQLPEVIEVAAFINHADESGPRAHRALNALELWARGYDVPVRTARSGCEINNQQLQNAADSLNVKW